MGYCAGAEPSPSPGSSAAVPVLPKGAGFVGAVASMFTEPPALGAGVGHGAKAQFGPVRPTAEPSGHTIASIVQACWPPMLVKPGIAGPPLSDHQYHPPNTRNKTTSTPTIVELRIPKVYTYPTTTLKPAMAMRLISKGMLKSFFSAYFLSKWAITFLLTWLRCALDLYAT